MQILFLVVAVVTVLSAMMVVSAKNMMHAALWLVLSLFGVAVIYGMLEASFFVVVQVMVYIGAIAIMIIFAVMLTQREKMEKEPGVNRTWWLSLIGAAGLFVMLVFSFSVWDKINLTPEPLGEASQDLAALGQALVSPSDYMIPFEVASVLLVAAMIGAIYLAMERRGGKG